MAGFFLFRRINFLIISFLFTSLLVFSQTERYVEIRAVAELDQEPLKGATVTLYEDNAKKSSVITTADGVFSFKLDVNKFYTVEVSKDSYVSKRISFDTHLPDEVTGYWLREFSISVMKSCEGVDYTPLKEPVDIIKFNSKRRDFDSDKDYASSMQSKIGNVYMQYEKCMTDKYNKLIQTADKQLKNKLYDEARANYEAAHEIFPDESYPDEQIEEIKELTAKQENIENTYQQTIKEADALFEQKRYDEALLKYKGAQTLKPQEMYPKQRSEEVQTIMAKNQAETQQKNTIEAQYNNLIAKGNAEMAVNNYAAAKQAFQQALTIKPNDPVSQSRVSELDIKIAEQAGTLQKQKETDQSYAAAIAQADKEFAAGNYESAKSLYMQASAMKPMEKYPSGKVTEIEKVVQTNQAMAEKAKVADNEKKYQSFLAQGDNLFKTRDYQGALDAYNQALLLKPNETYPKQRTDQINKLIAGEEARKQKEIDAGFQNAMMQAEKAAAAKDYQGARSFYLQAGQFKHDDANVKAKIAEMDQLILLNQKQKQQQQQVQDNYNAEVKKADQFFALKKYDEAKASYEQAKIIKPVEPYPSSKIQEIDRILAAASEAKKQQELQQNYQAAVSSANTLFSQKKYAEAKESYRNALVYKPDDAYSKNRIMEIDRLISEDQARQAALEIKNKQYNDAVAAADALFSAKNYPAAKTEYQKASFLIPEQQYPKQKIQEIDGLIAAAAQKQRETEAGFQKAMTAGNTFFNQKSYVNAKNSYQEALTYKPEDVTAKSKIAEIDAMMRQEQAKAAAEEQKRKQYNDLVASADALFAAKNYSGAKTEYQKAVSVIPSEQYPKQKIQEIDGLIAAAAQKQRETEAAFQKAMTAGNTFFNQKSYVNAKNSYQEALTYKPEDVTAKSKIAEIDAMMRQEQAKAAAEEQKKKQYNDLVASADALFAAKNYSGAKTEYQKAVSVIPSEQYPKQKIQEIDGLIAAEAQKQRETEAAFQKAMTAGNTFFNQKSYVNAKNSYQEALTYKPEDVTAKSKIAEIDAMMRQEQAKAAAEEQKKKQYNDLVASADALFAAKNYSGAKTEYQKAAQVMPSEVYPKQKVSEIDNILAQQKKQADEMTAKENLYRTTLAKADDYFVKKQYDQARTEYNKALEIKPGETYPGNKIAEIDKILSQLQLSKETDQNYTAAVAEADRYFNEKNYTAAKGAYNKALGFKPAESYPKSQVAKIDDLIAGEEKARQAEKANQEQYDLCIAQGNKLFSAQAYPQAKDQFTKALDLKPGETYPKGMIAKIDEILASKTSGRETSTNVRQQEVSSSKPELAELNFKNDSERDIYLAGLKKKYPEGITVEVYKQGNKITTRSIIIRQNDVREFREVFFPSWGGRECTLNGKPITKMYYDEQVKKRDGEYYKKSEF